MTRYTLSSIQEATLGYLDATDRIDPFSFDVDTTAGGDVVATYTVDGEPHEDRVSVQALIREGHLA